MPGCQPLVWKPWSKLLVMVASFVTHLQGYNCCVVTITTLSLHQVFFRWNTCELWFSTQVLWEFVLVFWTWTSSLAASGGLGYRHIWLYDWHLVLIPLVWNWVDWSWSSDGLWLWPLGWRFAIVLHGIFFKFHFAFLVRLTVVRIFNAVWSCSCVHFVPCFPKKKNAVNFLIGLCSLGCKKHS
jgi:hypothetical protein